MYTFFNRKMASKKCFGFQNINICVRINISDDRLEQNVKLFIRLLFIRGKLRKMIGLVL